VATGTGVLDTYGFKFTHVM